MLRLPQFGVVSPTSVEEAIEALASPGAKLLAGGTDLLPNMKHGLNPPDLLVNLSCVESLRGMLLDENSGELSIGASVTLSALAKNARILESYPSLARAASLVAGPQIRNTATLGGNLNLDTRCRYVNQSAFWRGSISGCLKDGGDVCHVVEKGRRCVAAFSSDTAIALISLGAEIEVIGASGQRRLPLSDYYKADGVRHIFRESTDILTRVIVPEASDTRLADYVKWRPRKSIDFPLVSVGICLDMQKGEHEKIDHAVLVVGVLGSRPKTIKGLETLRGMTLVQAADPASKVTHKQCKPLANVPYDPEYRRHLLGVLTRRAILNLAKSADTGS